MILDLIKLGGSVLTDKRGRLALREDVIDRIAKEVADGFPAERWQSGAGLVIVHGAGSFGHPRAQESGILALSSGNDPKRVDTESQTASSRSGHSPLAAPGAVDSVIPSYRDSVVGIQEEVRRLHHALLGALVRAGVPAISLPGAGFLRVVGGRLDRPDLTEVMRAAAQGFVPLSCGDVVVDPVAGPRVVSGDRVMVEICRQAEPERVTFVTDVEGIYDRNPANPGARLLAELELRDAAPRLGNDKRSHPGRGPAKEGHDAAPHLADVTGDMSGKLEAMARIARPGRRTYVLSGLIPGRLASFLAGDDVPGTDVRSSLPDDQE